MPKALIIGTGLGGLTTALRLTRLGYEVEMVEKYKQAGGRINQLRKNGFVWDIGPTTFPMLFELKEFYDDIGLKMPFDFFEENPLYSVNFMGDAKTYNVYKNIRKLSEEFASLEPNLLDKFNRYLGEAGRMFHLSEKRILNRNFRNVLVYLLSLTKVPLKYSPKFFTTSYKELDKYFHSDKIKEILSLPAIFLGNNPYKSAAIFMMLSYIELVHDGYHAMKGGMYRLVQEMLRELEKANVVINYNCEISGFIGAGRNVYSLIDSSGESHHADLYVVNADAAGFRNLVLHRKSFSANRLNKMKWSPAPFTIYLGIKGKLDFLNNHQYNLGDNLKEYTQKMDKNSLELSHLNYYVSINSRYNPEFAPKDCESLSILVPVPNLIHKTDWSDKEELANKVIANLSERIGVNLAEQIMTQTIKTPEDWEISFNLYHGSGLGLIYSMNQIGGLRPKNRDEKFKNLFYVGSSTIPGPGIGMSIKSSRLVVKRIERAYRNSF